MEQEEIFQRIAAILHDTFDIEPARITPGAMLGGDLDIDSIDAVDLIVQLKPMLGGNLRPEAFKAVRSVQDVVDTVYAMLHAGTATTGS
ncbi:MAG: acyl carrier protein [Lysobacteraceae bacterium]|nr:MAG: acyl carrier protein [Xanthomonadaceae bacterium]